MDRPRLTIELVPETVWASNVRTVVTRSEWDRLRKAVYERANHACEVCGGKGVRHVVECHEIWHYDDATLKQTLLGMQALCPSCHEVKHIGLAQVRGYYERAIAHLAKVNGWTQSVARVYAHDQFLLWQERSKKRWTLDLDVLKEKFDIRLKE